METSLSFPMARRVPTQTLIWTAGTTPPAAISGLPCKMERGRVQTDECMRVPDWPGVWALGDCAAVPDPLNRGSSTRQPHNTPADKAWSWRATSSVRRKERRRFRSSSRSWGCSPRSAGARAWHRSSGFQFSGFIAWWMWRGIYLSKLPGFPKKVRVAVDWILDFFSPRTSFSSALCPQSTSPPRNRMRAIQANPRQRRRRKQTIS